MRKYLHIASDEKFINSANWQFEQIYPGSNDFIILVPDNQEYKLKHVKQERNYKVYVENKNTLDEIIGQFENYDLVLLHSLNYFNSLIVNKAKASVKFVWIFWGYEVYKFNKLFTENIYGNQTQNKLIQKENISIKSKLIEKYLLLKSGGYKAKSVITKAQKRVDYFCGCIEEEFEKFSKLKIITGGYINWSYYPIEFIFKNHDTIRGNGNNILVGNSAEASNNHLEAFDILKQFKLDDRKVIVPLSYGDLSYANKLIPYGKSILGDSFSPLTKFYPLEEYNKILLSCNVLIMNHYRQQGFGNVLAMLWLGAKVYLDEKNVIYHYLKRIGIMVYSINTELKIENKEALNPLDNLNINHNRTIIFDIFGKKALLDLLKSQLDNISLS